MAPATGWHRARLRPALQEGGAAVEAASPPLGSTADGASLPLPPRMARADSEKGRALFAAALLNSSDPWLGSHYGATLLR